MPTQSGSSPSRQLRKITIMWPTTSESLKEGDGGTGRDLCSVTAARVRQVCTWRGRKQTTLHSRSNDGRCAGAQDR